MTVQLVFVDGIGGRRIYRNAFFSHFGAKGHICHYFDYRPSRESLGQIQGRLREMLQTVAQDGPYALVAYSFGGVLCRMSLDELGANEQPAHLFLIASPARALQLCQRVAKLAIFRILIGECGQLVASDIKMAEIGFSPMPTTCLYGTKGSFGPLSFLSSAPGDGMVSVVEAGPDLYADSVAQDTSHPFIATSQATIELVSARLAGLGIM